MARNQDPNGSKRGYGHGDPFAQLSVHMKHYMGGRGEAPQEIDVIGGKRTY